MASFFVQVQVAHIAENIATKPTKKMTSANVNVFSVPVKFLLVFENKVAFATSYLSNPDDFIHAYQKK